MGNLFALLGKLLAAIFTARQPAPAPESAPKPIPTSTPAPVPASDNFAACMAFVLQEEGGYSDVPGDSGGATNMGITLATLSAWHKTTCTAMDVKNLSLAEAEAIYRANYWNAMQCDSLPTGADLVVMDSGVMSGPGRAIEFLQTALGVDADGVIGPVTAAAMASANAARIITSISQQRETFYQNLAATNANDQQFLNGWMNRVNACQIKATQMLVA